MTDTRATVGDTAVRPWRRRAWLLARLLIGGTILWLVARNTNLRDVAAHLRGTGWLTYAAAVALAIGAQLALSANLRWALDRMGTAVSWTTAIRAHGLGLFANLFMPGAIGGDLVKSVALRREARGLTRAASAVILARAVGVAGLVVTALAGLLLCWPVLAGRALGPTVLIVLGLLLAAMAVGWFLRRPLAALGTRICPARLRPKFQPVFAVVAQLRPGTVAGPALIGLLYSLLAATWNGLFGVALGLDLAPAIYAFAVPAIYLLTLLPVTIHGIGVREAAYIHVLGHFGVPPGLALAYSLLVFSGPIVFGLAGGALVTLLRPRRSNAPDLHHDDQ